MPKQILLIGTGRMATEHANRYAAIEGAVVGAAVDVDAVQLQAFCREHDIANRYTNLDEALASRRFDACSVVTPDAFHETVSVQCLRAGLAVLCEKPLSDSVASADRMAAAASRAGMTTLVNLTYRKSGALQQARQMVEAGHLGEVRHVEASYRQSWLCSDYWGDWKSEDTWLWRLSTEHGSQGVLGDVGIHILDYLCAGTGQTITGLHCRLKTFDKAPGNRIGKYQLDANDSCVMNVELSNGALGVVHMSRFYTGHFNDVVLSIHGTEGAVQLCIGTQGDHLKVSLGENMHAEVWRKVECPASPDTFERFIDALHTGRKGDPDFAHAASLQRYIDLGFESHRSGRWVTV